MSSELRQYLDFIRPWNDDTHKVVTSQWDCTEDGKTTKRMLMRAAVDLNDVEAIIRYYDGKGENTWFSVQTFVKSERAIQVGRGRWFKQVNRKQQFVTEIHCFYADLDVKDGAYASLQDAVNAIYAFCAKLNLPPPSLLVCSGYGLHVYWRINQGMSLQQWQPIANALRNAMIQEGIMADHSCTIDGARILRPAGVRNWKDPQNPVHTYIIPGSSFQIYQLDWMTAPLAPFRGPHLATVGGQPVAQRATIATNQNLMAGVGESQPIDLHEVATECAVFEEQFRLAGAGTSQPLWSLVAMAAAFDHTPWQTFEELSRGYNGYDANAARAKLAEKMAVKGRTGWPSCNAFAAESTHCQTCVHFSAGKSPLNFKAKPVVNAAILPTAGVACLLPSPYWQETDGTIWGTLTDKKGVKSNLKIFKYPTSGGKLDEETGELLFYANIGHWQNRPFRIKNDKVRHHDIRTQLSAQGMESFEHEAQRLGDFIMAWVSHLRETKAATTRSVALGWNEDGSFTHGDTTWVNGQPVKAIYKDVSLIKRFTVKGSPKPWNQLMDAIYAENLPSMEMLVAASFGSPLVTFAAPASVMLSPYSPDTAAGKTTAMRAGQGVWGDPILGMSALDDTQAFVNKKIAELRHLPMLWDEIRTAKLLDQLVATVFRLSQGKDRDRLRSDISARETVGHATMMIACSNHSLAEKVIAATQDTDAGANRVFEVLMPSLKDRPGTRRFDDPIIDMRNGNYGHAGAAYAEWLSTRHDRVEKEVRDFANKLTVSLKAPGAERFWMATIAAIVCGAQFANEAGITRFNVKGILNFLVNAVRDLRLMRDEEVSMSSNALNLEELIDDIMSGEGVIFTNILSVHGTAQQITLTNNQGIEDIKRMQHPWAQFATQQDILRVNVTAFRIWLQKRGVSPRVVAGELAKYGMVKNRAAIGAGVQGFTAIGVTRPRCYDIPLGPIRASTP